MESRMAKEPQDEVRPVTESCKPPVHLGPHLASVRRSGIPQVLFDVTMAPLLRVQLRGVGWQPFHLNVGVCGEILLDEHSPMRGQAIPDDDHRPSDVPLEVAEGHQDICRANSMRNMSLVDLASERQANHRGPLPALAHTPQDRRVADGRPGGGGLRAKREAGLIDEHDGCASAASLFLMRGQSCLSQAWTKASSRSRAYTAGCCGLQPRALSRRARSWAWSCPPNATTITARIRWSVHRSVS